ncbi:uncharacterized protein KY384_001445 [Bacidia gigantensis]|uniref:uncharacterized protein n=1 Tax=Bacidia gigantensis TaxID=2732470 RepID=UPI001D0578EF|nr:uncharacterized protein KY384_001445 [Bacidia gigantensis]KAG8533704.1 hypothetical protein KY384_001445 [Bacidia gigantensis]
MVDANEDRGMAIEEPGLPQGPKTEPNSPSATSSSPLINDGAVNGRSKSNVDRNLGFLSAKQITLGQRLKGVLNSPARKSSPDDEIVQKIDDVYGYARVAAFQDSDPSWLQYRKFGWLHNNVLLVLQEELQSLEDELEEFFDNACKHEEGRMLIRSRDEDRNREHSEWTDIIDRIKEKLEVYGESILTWLITVSCALTRADDFLLKTQRIQALETPTKRDQNSVKIFVERSHSIVESEREWTQRREDLAVLNRNAERGKINDIIEDVLNYLCPRLLLVVFRAAYLVLLLLAIYTLFRLQPQTSEEVQYKGNLQIVATCLFTFAVAIWCTILTKARNHEVFMATAAFAAVLVVFMGNTTTLVIPEEMQKKTSSMSSDTL